MDWRLDHFQSQILVFCKRHHFWSSSGHFYFPDVGEQKNPTKNLTDIILKFVVTVYLIVISNSSAAGSTLVKVPIYHRYINSTEVGWTVTGGNFVTKKGDKIIRSF